MQRPPPAPPASRVNWAGSHTYTAPRLHRPTSIDDLRRVVAREPRVRALGSRHSFTALPDSPGALVSTDALPDVVEIDTGRALVRVAAGTTYARLAPRLHEAGWALGNLASLPHISVAGAVSTGTHGSGDGVGSLATQVRALELVGPEGDLRRVEAGDDTFAGQVVSLGALGVMTQVTLALEPTYDVRQWVLRDLAWDTLTEDLDTVTGAGYSVSVFTDWQAPLVDQVWVKSRDLAEPPRLPGATPYAAVVHMLPGGDVRAVTSQGGEVGPWHERLPHFRHDQQPSAGAELQSEYFVERAHAPAAIRGLRALGPLLAPVLAVSEIRTVAADDLWLSGSHGGDRVGFHFTWRLDWSEVLAVLPAVEEVLMGLGGRPHWGKVFTADRTALEAAHPRLADFRALRAELDPDGRFGSDFLADRVGL